MSDTSFGVGVTEAPRLLRANDFDLRETAHSRRVVALWRLITGYQSAYGVAILSLGLAALARAGSQFLLRDFVDHGLMDGGGWPLPAYATGFVLLGVVTGACSFGAGRLAAQTAEMSSRLITTYARTVINIKAVRPQKSNESDILYLCQVDR